MEKKSSKKQAGNRLKNFRDTVNYGIHSPGAFTLDALAGIATWAEEQLFEEEPKKVRRQIDEHRKSCAEVALIGLLALSLVLFAFKGCCEQNKKAVVPVRSEAQR